MKSEDIKYREYVRARLDELIPVFAKASVGDFFSFLEIPDGDEDFAKLYAGINILLETARRRIDAENARTNDLKDKVSELERLNRAMVGRELKIIELKEEVKKLRAGFESHE